MNEFQLDGKVALISGSARGLGAATAEALHAGGAKVVIADVLDGEGAQMADRIGANALFVHLDVTREADWEAAIAAAVERFGGIDVVVNNAGIETTSLLENCTLEEFDRTLKINVSGVFLGVKHAIRAMKPGGASGRGGSIVNISSGAGLKGSLGLGAYCSSKGAVRLLSKAAAVECGRLGYGIRVNSIHPGLIKTEMGVKTLNDYVRLGLMPDEATAEQAFLGAHLIGFGRPQDIANGVRYLASDAARWITGIELSIDGGYFAA
ncbi:glucose 1-dehydrogenase [Aromatoleum toluclasticum]|uniref:glucose 1-dehydrogenase n=1 Tax=Aromatoleum toluclasticum TaxID=92003 RepID=UPI00038277E2|nr:glucose 1-dehydrogenase [Aromatoleum toluclasticum]